jgi:hypothetical protein
MTKNSLCANQSEGKGAVADAAWTLRAAQAVTLLEKLEQAGNRYRIAPLRRGGWSVRFSTGNGIWRTCKGADMVDALAQVACVLGLEGTDEDDDAGQVSP